MSIADSAMVLNMTIGVWQGYRLDREASRRVTDDASAASDAARVNKHLIPKEALKEIIQASGALRNHFYSKTLPWKDNGDRLLPRDIYCAFMEEHAKLERVFKGMVRDFLTQGYPLAVERARFRMGTLFDINDYPAPRALVEKFYCRLDIDAVTQGGDFRVEMDEAERDKIRASMEQALQQRIASAMVDVWGRVQTLVERFVERTSDPKGVFRDTLVTNLTDLLEILPGLNITGDAHLAQVAEDIQMMLKGVEPVDLRKYPEVRNECATEAARILEDMGGFIKAWNVGA